jgi:hypothetical protein
MHWYCKFKDQFNTTSDAHHNILAPVPLKQETNCTASGRRVRKGPTAAKANIFTAREGKKEG